jgi:YidC/Oxa1 family membrane protein insertase
VDSCLDDLLEQLSKTGYHIIVRPHPQHVRHKREKLEKLKESYASNDRIEVQLDFSATDTVWKADLLITDWSDISMEYSFCTHKPVLFINTPMKIMNPEYGKIDVVPINVEIREIVGTNVSPEELNKIPELIDYLFENREMYAEKIREYEYSQVYNIGHSAEVGGKYVVEQLMERAKKKKEE